MWMKKVRVSNTHTSKRQKHIQIYELHRIVIWQQEFIEHIAAYVVSKTKEPF